MSPDGELDWRLELGGPSSGAPPVLTDGGRLIVVLGTDGLLTWLDLDGGIVAQTRFCPDMQYPFNGEKLPTASDTHVVMQFSHWQWPPLDTSPTNRIAKFRNDGSVVWELELPERRGVIARQALDEEENFYLVLYPFDGNATLVKVSPDGQIVWRAGVPTAQTDECTIGSPVLGADGTVLLVSNEKLLLAFDGQTGQERWRHRRPRCIGPEPVVDRDGIVYFEAGDEYLYAYDKQGQFVFRSKVGDDDAQYSQVVATPTITRDGSLLVPTRHGLAIVDRATGEVIDRLEGVASGWYSPLVDDAGVAYVVTSSVLRAAQTEQHGVADGIWVRREGNRYNSRWAGLQ